MNGEQWLAMIGRCDLTHEEFESLEDELTLDEAEWKVCDSPAIRLRYVCTRTTERKLRLYFCSGCRRQTHLYYRDGSFKYLTTGENYAEGLASDEERHWAEYGAEASTFGYDFDVDFWNRYPGEGSAVVQSLVKIGALEETALNGGEWIVHETVRTRLLHAAVLLEFALSRLTHRPFGSRIAFPLNGPDWPGCWLSDCVFGNPFRPVVTDPAWLTTTVQSIASYIYQDRAFDRLPILADALEEIGCTNADVLLHCRQPGEHVRGCWVVDLMLGKA